MDEHSQKVKAIQFIRPNAEFILNGDDLQWLDNEQKEPTANEIEAAWTAYLADVENKKQEAAINKAAAEAKLAELGLTADDLRALGL
jgi:hypothetical protein